MSASRLLRLSAVDIIIRGAGVAIKGDLSFQLPR